VRAIYGIGKSSIHISDTHDEAVEISRLLLNRNGRHFLNHGAPMRFDSTRRNTVTMRGFLSDNKISGRDVALDTGMVMGIYGLRAPNDMDVISDLELPPGPVEQHDAQYRTASTREILQDPSRHFSYAGLTYASLTEVAALKRKRLAGQDREDLLRIEPLLIQESSLTSGKSLSIRLRFAGLKLKRIIIRMLMKTGVGVPLRSLYRLAKGM